MSIPRIVSGVLLAAACGIVVLGQIHFPGVGSGSSTPKPAIPTPSSPTTPAATVQPKTSEPAGTPSFDYYVLSLSWSPAFCADPASAAASPKECAPGRRAGFVVHGFWPQANEGRSPESCEPTKPLAKLVLNMMSPYMPTASLVQHEWAEHGTCSGLSAPDYFTLVIQARVAVQLPVQITALDEPLTESPEQIEGQFAGANPSFPAKAFRTACRGGEFSEMRVCFDKNLKGRECSPSVGECASTAERISPPQ